MMFAKLEHLRIGELEEACHLVSMVDIIFLLDLLMLNLDSTISAAFLSLELICHLCQRLKQCILLDLLMLKGITVFLWF